MDNHILQISTNACLVLIVLLFKSKEFVDNVLLKLSITQMPTCASNVLMAVLTIPISMSAQIHSINKLNVNMVRSMINIRRSAFVLKLHLTSTELSVFLAQNPTSGTPPL